MALPALPLSHPSAPGEEPSKKKRRKDRIKLAKAEAELPSAAPVPIHLPTSFPVLPFPPPVHKPPPSHSAPPLKTPSSTSHPSAAASSSSPNLKKRHSKKERRAKEKAEQAGGRPQAHDDRVRSQETELVNSSKKGKKRKAEEMALDGRETDGAVVVDVSSPKKKKKKKSTRDDGSERQAESALASGGNLEELKLEGEKKRKKEKKDKKRKDKKDKKDKKEEGQAVSKAIPTVETPTVAKQPKQRSHRGGAKRGDKASRPPKSTTASTSAPSKPVDDDRALNMALDIDMDEFSGSEDTSPANPSHTTPTHDPKLLKGMSEQKPEHASLLANKWLTSRELEDLVHEGLVLRHGLYTEDERQAVRESVERYRRARGLTKDQLLQAVHNQKSGPGSKSSDLWKTIAQDIPYRSLNNIAQHIKRSMHPFGRKGPWTPEEDEELIRAVTQYGSNWKLIEKEIDRFADDCKDRWTKHLKHREKAKRGRWSEGERRALVAIIEDISKELGRDADSWHTEESHWQAVSERMGFTRNANKCRDEWRQVMIKQPMKSNEQHRQWYSRHMARLLQILSTSTERRVKDIDWKMVRSEWVKTANEDDVEELGVLDVATGKKKLVQLPWTDKELQRKFREQLAIKSHLEPDPVASIAQELSQVPRKRWSTLKFKEPLSKELVEDDDDNSSDPDATDTEGK